MKHRKHSLRRLFAVVLAFILVTVLAIWWFIMQPLLLPVSKASNIQSFSAKHLQKTVNELVFDYFPRDGANPENMQRCAQYIKTKFLTASTRVSFQTYTLERHRYHNVIASFGPKEGPRIIVGAHYDSAGELPGADDNASGVAGLLALANKLKDKKLSTRIDLVAYALEEPPYFLTDQMGSARHAFLMRDEKVEVKLMISLEMIGFYSEQEHSQEYPLGLLELMYPDKGDFIAVVGLINAGAIAKRVKSLMQSASDIEVYSINAPRFIPGIDFSDHLNYWNEGFPAVMITDTAFYRNHAYHTSEDTPVRLNYEKMADVLSGVFNVVVNY